MNVTAAADQVAQHASAQPPNVVEALVDMLAACGVRHAFGVSGGGIAALWAALSASEIAVGHFRHESGAVFAAIEAHFASGAPVAVFTTTGPGLTNALTGILAARGEGAKVILLSACTSAAHRGRWAIQQTDGQTMPAGLTTAGALFDLAGVLESPDALPQLARRIANGLTRAGGFICHIAIPTGMQTTRLNRALAPYQPAAEAVLPSAGLVERCASLLREGPSAIWLGFGARHAADAIFALAGRLNAPVMCSPRAKGIFPEDHPLFVGVTGMGGHPAVLSFMRDWAPRRVLVLGTRLGEPTSFWDPAMVPAAGFIHVDIDPDVPGVAYPEAPTFRVCADIGAFVTALLDRLAPMAGVPQHPLARRPELTDAFCADVAWKDGPIRPEALMLAIQRVVVDRFDSLVLAECGNAFTWATHFLRFRRPGRYRASTGVGSMGHCAAGVVGAALASGRKSVAVVGDGAMLMTNEINTAVKLRAPAVWIVLNDARYNMCEQGMAVLGLHADAGIPQVDFAMLARALGARGRIVAAEADLDAGLVAAMTADEPFVLDVRIDAARVAPSMGRNRGLRAQVATAGPDGVSFPVRAGL